MLETVLANSAGMGASAITWSSATVSSSFLEIDFEHMGQTGRELGDRR
jgi:hypothetical protein